MSAMSEYLAGIGFGDKGPYWQRDTVYIQFDDIVMRITVGKKHQDFPVDLVLAYPDQMDYRIQAVKELADAG